MAGVTIGDQSLWVDKHAPRSVSELSVHRKKVEELQVWLRNADAALQLGLSPSPRLLVLSGPTGSGKSTALSVVARAMGYELCEWLEARSQQWLDRDASFAVHACPSTPCVIVQLMVIFKIILSVCRQVVCGL